MKFFEKLFNETKITWKLLIIYSVVTGVVVGLLNCVPFLEKTSFVAPAVTFEYWFVAAIFIISNCESAKEASIKTFLFFLISQPLIYLVEVPFKAAGWGLFRYYPYWGKITVLTIPGAWIAYQIKRDNLLGAVILSVATGFLFATGVFFIRDLFGDFPRGLVGAVFCIMFSVILVQVIMRTKKTRIMAYICSLIFALGVIFVVSTTSSSRTAGIMLDDGHQWEIVEADTGAEISGNYLTVTLKKEGTYNITLKNEKGETVKYEAAFADGRMTIMEVEQ